MAEILRTGKNLGDAAVLKMTLFTDREEPGKHTEQAIRLKALNFTPLIPEKLAALPEGSFGFAYSQFLQNNKLSPFNFSSRIEDIFERFPVSTRYVRVHDMVHCLLDFDASIPGELGVYAFVGEQHYTKLLDWAARVADRSGRLILWQRGRIVAAQSRGRHLARGAHILVAQPLEAMLDMPLQEVRKKLIPAFFSAP